VGQPDAFQEAEPPAWVREWLDGRRQRAEKQSKPQSISDPRAAARRAAQREDRVRQGMDELALWLEDLMRQGLDTAQAQPVDFWETPAARLVDAQAPGLARMVLEMAALAHTGNGWQERLLVQAARTYLLVEGYRLLDQQSLALQSDLRALAGWTENQAELLQAEGIRDRWMVLGQRVEEQDLGGSGRARVLRQQRIWLWGEGTDQVALILHFAPPGQPLDASYMVGTVVEAELVFFPSAFPLRAALKERLAPPVLLTEMPGHVSIRAATAAYAAALAAQPWLDRFPLALGAIIPQCPGEMWAVQDGEGYVLPLSAHFDKGWELLALSGGQPVACFGEWNGDTFLPLSVLANTQWTILA
jgi:hypothetical protein